MNKKIELQEGEFKISMINHYKICLYDITQ